MNELKKLVKIEQGIKRKYLLCKTGDTKKSKVYDIQKYKTIPSR